MIPATRNISECPRVTAFMPGQSQQTDGAGLPVTSGAGGRLASRQRSEHTPWACFSDPSASESPAGLVGAVEALTRQVRHTLGTTSPEVPLSCDKALWPWS